MRNSIFQSTAVFLSVFFLAQTTLNAQEGFDKRWAQLEETHGTKKKKVFEQYATAIDRIGDNFRKAGDLENLLKAQNESRLARENAELGNESIKGAERIQGIMKNQLLKLEKLKNADALILRTQYIEELSVRIAALTKLGMLEEAVALNTVVAEQKSLLAGNAPPEKQKYSVTGKFHVGVDDRAGIYVNGESKYSVGIGTNTSPSITLTEGDSFVVNLLEYGGGKFFMFAFEIDDSKRVISFRAKDFKILGDWEKKKLLTPEEFEGFNKRARKLDRNPWDFPVKHKSEPLWGDTDKTVIGMVLTKEFLEK